jgi:putative two-component system response regulator
VTRILVIDDETVIRRLMCEILERAGYETVDAETAHDALGLLDDDGISLVVSDIVMPGLTGLELLEQVRARRPSLPVILVTGAGTYENLSQAVTRGADGLVIKPFSHSDLQNAVAAALERARRSERDVRERLLAPTIAAALANAIEARDGELQGHCERLAALAVRIAAELGLSPTAVEHVRLGAVLHDVGKIGVPDHVLRKPGPLTDEERTLMRIHPLIGDRMLAPLDFLPDVRSVVRHHHERWDGGGYPDGLAREAIPQVARIVAVADAVEAMSAPRPYRAPLGREAILDELAAGRGSQWDPAPVDVVLRMIEHGELRFAGDGLRLTRAGTTPAPCRDRSVLLVEHDEVAGRLAVESIEGAIDDVRVVHARDIRSATELCRSSRWALALVDDTLPDGDGLEFLRAVKERTPTLPVLMLTSEGAEATAIEAFRRGASDYVVKSQGYAAEVGERVRALLADGAAVPTIRQEVQR